MWLFSTKEEIESIFYIHHEIQLCLEGCDCCPHSEWMDLTCSGEGKVGEHCQALVTRFSWSPCFILQWSNEFTKQQLSFSHSFPVLFLMVYFVALWFSVTKRFQQVVYTAHLYYRSGIKYIPNAALHLCLDPLPDLNIMVSNSVGLRHLSYPWSYFMLGKKPEAWVTPWRWDDKTLKIMLQARRIWREE